MGNFDFNLKEEDLSEFKKTISQDGSADGKTMEERYLKIFGQFLALVTFLSFSYTPLDILLNFHNSPIDIIIVMILELMVLTFSTMVYFISTGSIYYLLRLFDWLKK